LTRVFRSNDLLFRSGNQFPGSCRPVPHALNGIHHIAFLSQKRISKIGSPGNVFCQVIQDAGKNDESLYAGIPVLTLCRLRQRLIAKIRITLQPLTRFNNFKWICSRDKNLADQRIRIQCNRCDKIIQLIPRKELGRSWNWILRLRQQRGSRTHQHCEYRGQ
jgi:hypothetical protein